MRKRLDLNAVAGLLAISLTGLLLPEAPAHAGSCLEQIKRDLNQLRSDGEITSILLSKLRPGEALQVKLSGETDVHQGKFLGTRIEGGQTLYQFELESPEGRAQVSVDPEDVHLLYPEKTRYQHPVARVLLGGKTAVEIAKELPLGLPGFLYTEFRLHRLVDPWRPYRRAAQAANFVVDVAPGVSMERGRELARQIGEFDRYFGRLGFKPPERTQVILRNLAILNNHGSHFSPIPVFSLRDGRYQNLLVLQNHVLGLIDLDHPQLLPHERTHSFLHGSYAESAWVNRNSVVQEALADFAAASYRGSPDGQSRNIVEFRDKTKGTRASWYRLEGTDPHQSSLYLSNFLWKTRQELGEPEMDRLFKPFVDNLNAYRASYESWLGKRNELQGWAAPLLSDIEYVAATLLKTAQGTSSEARVRKSIAELVRNKDYSLDGRRIEELQSVLIASPSETYAFSSKEISKEIRKADTIAIATVGVAAATAYVTHLFYPADERKRRAVKKGGEPPRGVPLTSPR